MKHLNRRDKRRKEGHNDKQPPRKKSIRQFIPLVIAAYVGFFVYLLLHSRSILKETNDIVNQAHASMIGEGFFSPEETNKKSNEIGRHAIVVPYRGRDAQLMYFKQHMSDYFKRFFKGRAEFDIWIVEQNDDEPFNRAWLTNIGVLEAQKYSSDVVCIVVHDVDLYPDPNAKGPVPYDYCPSPIRLGNELQNFAWSVPYPDCMGGVVGLSTQHWERINGMSNMYIGWGGEDDDLFLRIKLNKLLKGTRIWDKQEVKDKMLVPPHGHGVFLSKFDDEKNHVGPRKRDPAADRFIKTRLQTEMKRAGATVWKTDGLNSTTYNLTAPGRPDIHYERPAGMPGFASYHHIFATGSGLAAIKNNPKEKTRAKPAPRGRPNQQAAARPKQQAAARPNKQPESALNAARAKNKTQTSSTGSNISKILSTMNIDISFIQNRMSPLSTSGEHKFSFVHISKTGGASWIRELLTLLKKDKIQPDVEFGLEHSVATQKRVIWAKIADKSKVKLMTSFKHPRAHVWSQWGQCVFDKIQHWHDKIPYDPNTSYEKNFENWLDHFLIPNNSSSPASNSSSTGQFGVHAYRCYHPANLQSRFLVGPAGVSPQIFQAAPKPDEKRMTFEPEMDIVRSIRNEFDWIGIVEFFHASKCLLFHRLNKKRLEGDVADKTVVDGKVSDFLSEYCHCPIPESTTGKQVNVHIQHFTEGKRSSMIDLDPALLSKIDTFIKIDTINYREALIQFLLEIASLEQELGRRVLCDKDIERVEAELEYIGLPGTLSEVYKWTKAVVASEQ